MMRCRSCDGTDGEIVLDLGVQPSWDRMPWRDEPLPDPVFDLRMWLCRGCGLAQLRSDADGDEELIAVEPRAVTEQSDRSVERLRSEGLVRPGRTVAEFGSPHGESWLPRLTRAGMVAVPAAADPRGDGDPGGTACPVTPPGALLPVASVEPAGPDLGPADLVVDYYGLLHEPDQAAALRRRVACLAPGGTLVLQMLPLGTVLTLGQWFDLRHGHYAYWSLPALDRALREHGLGIHRAWRYPLSGGTALLTARRDPAPDEGTLDLIEQERAAGVEDPRALRRLQHAAGHAGVLRDWLAGERAAGRTVVGYGAASRSVPLLCHAGLDAGLLSLIGDVAATKQGRRMPGTDIPVVRPDEIEAAAPDRVLLFLPELADEVRETMPGVEAAGGRWVVLDPEPRVLEPALVR